jgi:hypothetical protein
VISSAAEFAVLVFVKEATDTHEQRVAGLQPVHHYER